MIDLTNFDPVELGLPEKFPSFRSSQQEFVEWVTSSNKRFLAAGLPTGSGKTLSAMALARATGLRTGILTVTKGLEAQYDGEFRCTGHIKNIHGKANYPCGDINTSCRFGALEGCRLAGNLGCTYESERAEAKHKDIVLTNYAYWIRINEYTRGLEFTEAEAKLNHGSNPFELLILDEAGKADVELARSLAVGLRETWLRTASYKGRHGESVQYWANFASQEVFNIGETLKQAVLDFKKEKTKKARDRVYELSELIEALESISRMTTEHWVCELQQGTNWGRKWNFDCIWPGGLAESKLFIGIPKVVLMGATLKPMHLSMMGVKKGQYEFREWPRVFPAHHTPVYYIPTVKLNSKTGEADLKKWVDRIDEIIESRLERKGIIHTVSYARQQYLAKHSRFRQYMLLNTNDPDSESAVEVVKRFKESTGSAILVSPSFSTGWDFPGRECEWQIIAKLAFPDNRSKVLQARLAQNPRYTAQMVMQDLVQACGRGTRTDEDRCEIFIVDNQIVYFMMMNSNLAPSWFEIRTVKEVPKPGKRCVIKEMAA